jgi:hypothetical protein
MRSRGAVAASVLGAVAVAVATAHAASATDDISLNAVGTYEVAYPWATTTWVVTPCDDDADQCVHVVEYGAGDTEQKNPGWSANAYWQVGSWMIKSVDTPDALTCDDGSKHGLPMNYSWDAATNAGVRSYYEPGICGHPYSGANRITLTKIDSSPPAN